MVGPYWSTILERGGQPTKEVGRSDAGGAGTMVGGRGDEN
jgi:hypothetical protein